MIVEGLPSVSVKVFGQKRCQFLLVDDIQILHDSGSPLLLACVVALDEVEPVATFSSERTALMGQPLWLELSLVHQDVS